MAKASFPQQSADWVDWLVCRTEIALPYKIYWVHGKVV